MKAKPTPSGKKPLNAGRASSHIDTYMPRDAGLGVSHRELPPGPIVVEGKLSGWCFERMSDDQRIVFRDANDRTLAEEAFKSAALLRVRYSHAGSRHFHAKIASVNNGWAGLQPLNRPDFV